MLTMNRYHEKVKELLPGGVHHNFNLPWEEIPIHYSKTKGSRVWDMDGNEYLDLYARFGATILGHNNNEYKDALKDIIDRVLSVSHCDMDLEVLQSINKFVPSAEMIRFGLSGTEIVQNAIRVARAYTGKNKFVRFNNHYHGNADNIMGGCSTDYSNPTPKHYTGDIKGTEGRAKNILQDQSYMIEWNDAQLLEDLLTKHGDDIAAVIMEPVCVNGGSIMPVDGYLERVRELCDEYNVVLIFDEIITGFRMGIGGAQTQFGVTPDLTTLAKAMGGGGVPVSALVGKKEIMQLLTEKRVIHAGTFNGYPLGTAAVKTTLDILSRDNGMAYKNMCKNAERIHRILIDTAKEVNFPLIVQGPPACAAYHSCEKELLFPSEFTEEIQIKDIILNAALQRNGILISSVSRIYPNISLSSDDVSWFERKAEKAIKEAKELIDEIYS